MANENMSHEISAPRVSALVTTFNHADFIEDSIESLLDQTYTLAEIIVVDDGSHDSTFELASRYHVHGVRVLHGPQKGPSHAMNLAMSKASGDIFLLQSGDDMSLPTRADNQVRALAEADLNASFPILIDGKGNRLDDEDFSIFFRMHSVNVMSTLFKSLYEDGNFLCASSIAMRRVVWEKLGGFHPGLLQLQDYEYWLRSIVDGFIFSIDPCRIVKYRIHNNNLSRPENNVRMYRELGTIFRNIGPDICNEFISSVLYGQSFVGICWSDVDRKILLSMLFLRHHVESVRQVGVDMLIDGLNDPQISLVLKEKFNLSHRDVFRAFLHS